MHTSLDFSWGFWLRMEVTVPYNFIHEIASGPSTQGGQDRNFIFSMSKPSKILFLSETLSSLQARCNPWTNSEQILNQSDQTFWPHLVRHSFISVRTHPFRFPFRWTDPESKMPAGISSDLLRLPASAFLWHFLRKVTSWALVQIMYQGEHLRLRKYSFILLPTCNVTTA